MSNRRRKTHGQTKLQRNLLVRVIRGARKNGTPLPGHGSTYNAPEGWQLHHTTYQRGIDLRTNTRTITGD